MENLTKLLNESFERIQNRKILIEFYVENETEPYETKELTIPEINIYLLTNTILKLQSIEPLDD